MPTTNQNAPVGSWLKISDKLQNVVVTNETVYPVRVHVGTAAPAAGAASHPCTSEQPFVMSGVTGQDVYIRSAGATAVPVVVTAV